ncbi:MAG: hypothetical protein DI538_18195, partial [Azospira oryzae]
DTLVCFNSVELKSSVKQIQAELERAKANVKVSGSLAEVSFENARAAGFTTGSDEQSIHSAKATLDRAEQELNRAKQLLNINAITQNSYEQLQTQLDIAKASYLKAQAIRQSSASSSVGLMKHAAAEQQQVSIAKTSILQKEAELESAQERLRHAYIIAPFDGIITKRSIQLGQYVRAKTAKKSANKIGHEIKDISTPHVHYFHSMF